jgi:SAM-dependent methyltransferase
VDPSREMRVAAIRRCAELIADGCVAVRAGAAAAPGLPDESVDLAVSVNTVAIWPDLRAGVDGLHRVLRPGGQLVLSWHGGRQPGRASRRLVLAEPLLDRIEAALAARFPDVRRLLTARCTVFVARR